MALDVGSADGLHDWPRGELAELRTYVARTPDGVLRGLERGYRVVTMRPDGLSGPRYAPLQDYGEQLAEIAVGWPDTVVLGLSEAHLVCPAQGDPPDSLLLCLTRARHAGVYVVAETVHVARISTWFRDESAWYVHYTQSARDVDAIVSHALSSTYVTRRSREGEEHIRAAMDRLNELEIPGLHIIIDRGRTRLEPQGALEVAPAELAIGGGADQASQAAEELGETHAGDGQQQSVEAGGESEAEVLEGDG